LITHRVRLLAEFYAAVLGVALEGDDQHMLLATEGAELAIFAIEGMEAMAPGCTKGAGYGSATLMFEVSDVDAEYVRLRGMGVEIVKLPQTHPWGARSVWFRDPDGNIVDFYTQGVPV